MKLVRSAIMAMVAKKVYDEARKPENQAKVKKFIADLQNRNSSGTARTPGGPGRG
jgi:hypothetical protein